MHSLSAVAMVLLSFLPVPLSAFILSRIWKRKGEMVCRFMMIILLSVMVWSMMHTLQMIVDDHQLKLLFAKLTYIGITMIPPSWFLVACIYTRNLQALVDTRYRYLLYILPVSTLFLRLTDDYHHLIWSSASFIEVNGIVMPYSKYGPWFWIFTTYGLFLIIAGSGMLIAELANYSIAYRRRYLILFLSAIIPFISAGIYLSRIYPTDLTPLSFSVSTLLFALLISSKIDYIDLIPIARDRVIESMEDGVMVFDDRGRLIDANESARRMIPDEDLMGKDARDLPEEIRDILYKSDGGILERGGRYYDVKSRSILDGRGREMGRVAIIRDVTEIEGYRRELERLNRNLEEEVNRKTEEIRKLLKQKDEFISQLGHDLKTPLTPIVSLLPIIRERIRDDDVKKLVDVVIRNANYMKNLVTDTLRLAQLNSRDYRFNLEDLELHDVVEESIEDNRYLLMEKNISPENRIPKGVIVRADKLRLKEVFANLISNSIRYTPEGGRIEFRAREEGNEVMVEVRDNGRGLSEEEKERIFDEFYKVDRSRRDLDTSGLGLTICKKIVERHGGRIWAESDGLGKGTSICFTLPLQKFNKR